MIARCICEIVSQVDTHGEDTHVEIKVVVSLYFRARHIGGGGTKLILVKAHSGGRAVYRQINAEG